MPDNKVNIFQFTASYEADPFLYAHSVQQKSFNSQPHTRLTRVDTGVSNATRSFNSQPHTRLTTSATTISWTKFNFQFTASYEADRGKASRISNRAIFQFTASYEADPQSVSSVYGVWKTFNSQPHTRLTFRRTRYLFRLISFNSQPHTRLTTRDRNIGSNISSFNSQPHTRLTVRVIMTISVRVVFQFTASYEADLFSDTEHGARGYLSIHSLIRG